MPPAGTLIPTSQWFTFSWTWSCLCQDKKTRSLCAVPTSSATKALSIGLSLSPHLYPQRDGQPLFPVSLAPCQTPHHLCPQHSLPERSMGICSAASGGIGTLGNNPHISTWAPPNFSKPHAVFSVDLDGTCQGTETLHIRSLHLCRRLWAGSF